jgi:hypothetical protein
MKFLSGVHVHKALCYFLLYDLYLDEIVSIMSRSGGHIFAWGLMILNQIGTLGCVVPSIGQLCGECGRKVAQDSCTGVPTAMRRL